jgi:hypothetical protein
MESHDRVLTISAKPKLWPQRVFQEHVSLPMVYAWPSGWPIAWRPECFLPSGAKTGGLWANERL